VEQGRAAFAVSPLRAGESFSVHTRPVRVDVLGTRFAVESDPSCSRVAVEHGVVRATPRRGAPLRLRAGQAQTFCLEPTDSEVATEAERLLRRAIDRVQAGEDRAAIPLLQRHLERFAAGPLAEDALFHLVLAHHRLGQNSARDQQARRFLRRFSTTQRAARLRRLQENWSGDNTE
jgi:hypothetical protein